MKYGFIGCGNMGGALATALSKTTKDIMLADFDAQKAENLAKELNCSCGTNDDVVLNCDRIFLGVKPQVMESVLAPLKEKFAEKMPLIVTMAAGIKIKTFEELCGVKLPTIRIMPNTPVSVGKGMVLFCANELVGGEEIDDFLCDMRFSGEFDRLPEELIDAGCSVSGCGPAFMYMFIDALAEGGVACGLSREQAVKYAAITMQGAAELALKSGKEPEQLRIEVCSPGGSTIEGVKTFEKGGLKECAINAVKASYKRNKELGN